MREEFVKLRVTCDLLRIDTSQHDFEHWLALRRNELQLVGEVNTLTEDDEELLQTQDLLSKWLLGQLLAGFFGVAVKHHEGFGATNCISRKERVDLGRLLWVCCQVTLPLLKKSEDEALG